MLKTEDYLTYFEQVDPDKSVKFDELKSKCVREIQILACLTFGDTVPGIRFY